MRKQFAKQIAAMAMIKLIEGKIETKELETLSTKSTMTFEVLPTVEEVLARYRRVKNKTVPPTEGRLSDRSDFFLKLPEKNRTKAKQILVQDHSDPIEAEIIVYETMAALDLKFEIKQLKANQVVFTLKESTYDCTIKDRKDRIFPRIIDYLRNMLNMKCWNGALSDVTNRHM